VHHEHEVGPGRNTPALLYGIFAHGAGLEGIELLGALSVERHLDDARQPVALQRSQAVGLNDGHLALDQPGLVQAPHAPQAGGGRHMHLFSQLLVALPGIALQQVEQLQVDRIKRH